MSSVSFTMDGRAVTAETGETLLTVARANGIDIPTFCHHDEIEDYGACRLCIVEVKKGRSSKVVTSCLYPVEEGIEVLTETDRIVRYRRTILELMQAKWPDVPKELIERYQVPQGRLVKSPTFCILCGICVRYCEEVRHSNVLGFMGRGVERQVVVYPGEAKLYCAECSKAHGMECVNACPTGVIVGDFAAPLGYPRATDPLAYPVRMRDDDNIKKVKKTLGG